MTRPIIFRLDESNGFFCLFFLMCNAYIASKKMGSPFYITHLNWCYTYSEGWHDYFITLQKLPLFPRLFNPNLTRANSQTFILFSHEIMVPKFSLSE